MTYGTESLKDKKFQISRIFLKKYDEMETNLLALVM